MRVNPDRQTLILAGETPPGRYIGTPVQAEITEAEFSDTVTYGVPAASARQSSYSTASLGSAFSGASAYARTQALSDRYHPVIDTYA